MLRRFSPLWLIILALNAFPQKEAPPKIPLPPNPGRALKLEELLRIKSEGQGYYFTGINQLELDKEGCLYFQDYWISNRPSHLLKFAPDGRFLKDLNRRGEGPGEIQSGFDFALADSEVFLYDLTKRKIVVKNLDGVDRAEIRKVESGFDGLLGAYGDGLIFQRVERPTQRTTSRLYDENNIIVWLSLDGRTEKKLASLIHRQFYVSFAQGGGGMSWDPFVSAIGKDRIYVNSTQEYQVQVVDLDTGRITDVLRREYSRVKRKTRDDEKMFAARYNAPLRSYENDIRGLFHDGSRLWVQTSTGDETSGFLFDLYDAAGRYVDSVRIRIKGRIVKIDGDVLYAGESDKDDLPNLVKYRIAEPVGLR